MPKPRHPAEDPQPGDVLAYRGWTVTVLGREDDGQTVLYKRTAPDKPLEGQRTQSIESWKEWALLATVEKSSKPPKEDRCLVFNFYVSGPCTACKSPLADTVHVVADAGVFHEGCCPEKIHGKTKRKAKEQAA